MAQDVLVTAFVSAQGGAGKTSFVAHLGSILAARGIPVLAVEWDPANRLAFHLGSPAIPECGWVTLAAGHKAWQDAALENSDGVQFLPFGSLAESQRLEFEEALARDHTWLARALRSLDLPAGSHILLDVLRAPSVYLEQALLAADLVLGVLTPCPAFALDLALLDTASHRAAVSLRYLLNGIDTTHQLSRDISLILRSELAERLLHHVVHRDQAVPEAIAANASLAAHAPDSQAAHDLQGLASWLTVYANERTAET